LTLSRTRDSLALANTLQAKQAGLKDQVLEYRMVDWRSVKPYMEVMGAVLGVSVPMLEAQVKEDPKAAGFHHIDVSLQTDPVKEAIAYACRDAIWTRELYDKQVEEHNNRVGNITEAQFIRDANDFSAGLLAETAAYGYLADKALLERYIAQVSHIVDAEEQALLTQLRTDLGWPLPTTSVEPPPTLFGVVGVKVG
jgi:hypothetical protein